MARRGTFLTYRKLLQINLAVLPRLDKHGTAIGEQLGAGTARFFIFARSRSLKKARISNKISSSLKIWLMPSAPRSEPPYRESRISALEAAEENEIESCMILLWDVVKMNCDKTRSAFRSRTMSSFASFSSFFFQTKKKDVPVCPQDTRSKSIHK